MATLRLISALLLVTLFAGGAAAQKIGGITVVAPPRPIGLDAFERVSMTNADWVCLVPYGFQRKGQTSIRFNLERQWWGEREEGLIHSIELAHKNCMKVMLKPQVYMHGSWVGDMDFDDEASWQEWETAYEAFFDYFLQLAVDHKVDLFCIGTEYKIAAQKREKFWRRLIGKARKIYKGQLVYSSNWDGYDKIPFWDALDFIGISAYFPLCDDETPSVSRLQKEWNPIRHQLRRFAKKYGKRILFTEYGYLTTDQCAYRAWELEKMIPRLEKNETAQANAFKALYETFHREDWWAGGFIWKWFPDGMGHEGYKEKDYDVQDKKAEDVVRTYYGKFNTTR